MDDALCERIVMQNRFKGHFITLEGPEGSGKSTQARLLFQYCKKHKIPVLLTREPGGTRIGKKIRRIILDPASTGLSPRSELLLYFADRAQHVDELIFPALKKGWVVISDRFTDATLAYQGGGRGLDTKFIKRMNEYAASELKPDVTVFLNINIHQGLVKAKQAKSEFGNYSGDRMEKESAAFHKRVHTGYLKIIREDPGRFLHIRSKAGIDGIHSKIIKELQTRGIFPE